MNEPGRKNLGWGPFVGKGALGGAFGSVLFLLLGAAYLYLKFGKDALRDLPIIGAVFGLVAGSMVGLAVGFLIFSATRKWRHQPGSALRVGIGFGCVLASALGINMTKSWPTPLVFSLVYAALVGGLAGLMAKTKAG